MNAADRFPAHANGARFFIDPDGRDPFPLHPGERIIGATDKGDHVVIMVEQSDGTRGPFDVFQVPR